MIQLREYLEKHPSETQKMLGIDYDPLIELLTNVENLYDRHKKHCWSQKTRILKPGSARPLKLTIADQILLTGDKQVERHIREGFEFDLPQQRYVRAIANFSGVDKVE